MKLLILLAIVLLSNVAFAVESYSCRISIRGQVQVQRVGLSANPSYAKEIFASNDSIYYWAASSGDKAGLIIAKNGYDDIGAWVSWGQPIQLNHIENNGLGIECSIQ